MLELSTIVFMVIILGATWGTLGLLISKARRKEKKKVRIKK